jgi:NifU-like protein involved in Fe-S cluster formation
MFPIEMNRQQPIDIILDPDQNPRHYGPMDDPTITHRARRPAAAMGREVVTQRATCATLTPNVLKATAQKHRAGT